ncbi:MAG: peptidoglycan DD-metalloendopeptidase family protein [Candidatus Pacebacteria bacterium]|nr:peptidoglycan DD-metalloendopeptidase family protein [Candidatus Paceibacterota bacterium]
MPNRFKVLLGCFFLFFIIGANSVFADANQDKINQLRAQIEALEAQAEQYRGTIAQTKAQADTLKAQIQNLQNQIGAINNQIALLGKKIDKTQIEIVNVQGNIKTTQEKIEYQKATIGQLLLYLAKRDNETFVGVLMKNSSLSDYFNQEEYALTVNSKLMALIDEFKQTQKNLSEQKNDLEDKKKDLQDMKQQEDAQRIALAAAQTDKNKLLKVTKGQEAQYQKLLIATEQQESIFFNQMRELETHIIQGGLYIVHVTADSNLPKTKKGLFAWPESPYRNTQGYGCTSYARCGRSSAPYGGAGHNGIDMATGYGSPIKAIADGEIIANGKNDGWGNWVAIKHPTKYNLVSIYGHMSSLSFLQVGSQVTVGQVIGYEGNTGAVTGSHLHLSIYKDFFTYVSDKKSGQLYFNYFEGTVNPLNYF